MSTIFAERLSSKNLQDKAVTGGHSRVRMVGYDPLVYKRLSRFHLAKEMLDGQQENILELGRVIRAHGLEEIIGVNLLHKHFDLRGQEMLVREFDQETASITPWQPPYDEQTIPYLWKMARGQDGEAFYPLEFSRYREHCRTEVRSEYEQLSTRSEFLRDLARMIKKLRVAAIFGIATLHSRHFLPIRPGKTILETTDEEGRVLTLQGVEERSLDEFESTQTLWIFSDHS